MTAENPLSEADSRSLDDLYAADPLSLTNGDVDKIVDVLIQKRVTWQKEDSEAQAQGRSRRPKAYKTPPTKGQLSLGDLGLDKE